MAALAGTTWAGDPGIQLSSREGQVTLNVHGFAQARYTDAGDPGSGRSRNFDLALGRLAFEGSAFDSRALYFFQIETSTFGNHNRVNMLDAWVGYNITRSVTVQAGRFLLPYSRQFYTHPGNLLFTDLSEADYAFNLPRSVGSAVSVRLGRTSLHGAVMNSVRALDGSGQQNMSGRVGALGRMEVDVLAPYGYNESLARPAARTELSIGAAVASNPVQEGSVLQNSLTGDRTSSATVDAGFRWKRLTAQAAGYGRMNQFRGRHGLGGYAQAGYQVSPGTWEVAARVSSVDFGAAHNPLTPGDIREYTVGVNRYLRAHNVKFQADYGLLAQRSFTGAGERAQRLRLQLQILF